MHCDTGGHGFLTETGSTRDSSTVASDGFADFLLGAKSARGGNPCGGGAAPASLMPGTGASARFHSLTAPVRLET
jgi:hypothetical protein